MSGRKGTWSDAETDYLRRHYPNEPTRHVAKAMGRTFAAVRSRARVLKLLKGDGLRYRVWSRAEEDYLRKHYADGQTRDLAEALGRPVSKVYAKAKKLGLEKSAAYLRRFARLQPGRRVSPSTEFPKGHVPANKGLRRPGYSKGRGRMQETQFKKGNQPENYLPIGTERIDADGYLRVKIADGLGGTGNQKVWPFLHRHRWEQAHGPIPEGYTVVFKDGDRSNCALENLELISRKELMARNTIHNMPAELKQVIQLKGRLKRCSRSSDARELEKPTAPASSSRSCSTPAPRSSFSIPSATGTDCVWRPMGNPRAFRSRSSAAIAAISRWCTRRARSSRTWLWRKASPSCSTSTTSENTSGKNS